MNFFPHAKSATFARDFSDQKNNPFRPLRDPSPTPHAKSAKTAKLTSKLLSHFHTFILSHLSTIHHPKSKIQNLKFGESAFSLTEVVIAMGVAAVAFTSIIALFPLGLNMSKESYEATQAALIAQTILADLQDEGTGSGTLGSSRFIQIGGNSDPSSTNYLAINFNTASTITVYLAYNQIRRTNNDTDSLGEPIMLRPCAYTNGTAPNWYTSGSNGLSMLVKVSVTPCFRINGASASGDPKRVDVSVESPGDASATNRSQFLFTGGTPPG
jgi:type II secretory pathway pseudopilin PulG